MVQSVVNSDLLAQICHMIAHDNVHRGHKARRTKDEDEQFHIYIYILFYQTKCHVSETKKERERDGKCVSRQTVCVFMCM